VINTVYWTVPRPVPVADKRELRALLRAAQEVLHIRREVMPVPAPRLERLGRIPIARLPIARDYLVDPFGIAVALPRAAQGELLPVPAPRVETGSWWELIRRTGTR
jgi:hypothetical protein